MCVMMIKPAGFSLNREDLSEMYEANPNGIGVAWFDGTRRQHAKYLPTSAEDACEFIYSLDMHDSTAILHFRWATHGEATLANCHPFNVTESPTSLLLFHNGVLNTDWLGLDCGDGTDTEAFVKKYIAHRFDETLDMLQHKELTAKRSKLKADLEFLIGGSKMITMDSAGRTCILNEDAGTEMCFEDAFTGEVYEFWISNGHWASFARQEAGYNYYQYPVTEVNYEFS